MFKTILLLFITFLKVGVFTIGSGYAMLPLLHKEMVENQKWLTDEEFTEFVSISEITPGPIMINLAIIIGFKQAKVPGAIAAVSGVVLFPAIFILILINLLIRYRDVSQVRGMMFFIKPVAIGLIATSILKLGSVTFKDFKTIGIALITVLMVYLLKINPIYVVVSSILIGLLLHKFI